MIQVLILVIEKEVVAGDMDCEECAFPALRANDLRDMPS